jgi:hypothetical protein
MSTHDRKRNSGIRYQSISGRKIQGAANGCLIFAAERRRYGYQRCQWQGKVLLLEKDAAVALRQPGVAGKTPGLRRSTAQSVVLLSGDRLKGATLEHSLARNGGKSSPCQENIAIV